MDDLGSLRDLRRLRVIAVAVPIGFLAALELFRYAILDQILGPGLSHLAAALSTVLAALVFGLLIFIQLDRTQRHVVRQNRDLAVVNGVSAATQGELDVDAALRDALRRIVDLTGASEASVTVHPLDPESGPSHDVAVAPASRAGDALAGPERLIELPLSAGGSPVGRLKLRVPEANIDEMPSPDALHMIVHQLATAIQVGELVDDLQNRRLDGHTFYQSLLQTSNQAPLAETLTTIVDGARDRLSADDGHICLTRAVLEALEVDAQREDGLAGGGACEAPGTAGQRQHACAIGSTGHSATLRVPLWAPGELLGDLWVARNDGPPFTERDRRYLQTLGGIAAIAIAAARLRTQDRQGAILAERDRIARELHDSLAQVLGSTHLRLRHLLGNGDVKQLARVSSELEDLADVAEEAYRDVREAILGLREASRPRGFVEALHAYLDKYAIQSGIPVDLETSSVGHPSLTAGSEIQVLRVIQEALTNVRKHARATRARVRVTAAKPDGLMIVIEDDGRGFDPNAVHGHRDGGYGLQTMRERMELAGGSLRVDSSPNNGTRIIAIVPGARTAQPSAALADHR